MINTIKLKGTLNEGKGMLKQKIAIFTNNDLLLAEGKKDEALGKLQMKYAKARKDPFNYHSIFFLDKTSDNSSAKVEFLTTHKKTSLREEFAHIATEKKGLSFIFSINEK